MACRMDWGGSMSRTKNSVIWTPRGSSLPVISSRMRWPMPVRSFDRISAAAMLDTASRAAERDVL